MNPPADPAASDGDRPERVRHQLIEDGLGRFTRVLGTVPGTSGQVVPRPAGMREVVDRLGIPAVAQKLCATAAPDLACFTSRDGRRVVEPGLVESRVSASSRAAPTVITVNPMGDQRVVGHERRLRIGVSIADS